MLGPKTKELTAAAAAERAKIDEGGTNISERIFWARLLTKHTFYCRSHNNSHFGSIL